MKIAFFDLETTGTDKRKDSVVEIGIIVIDACKYRDSMNDKGVLKNKYHQLINPGCNIPAKVTEIHGIKDEDVKDKPSLVKVWPEILKVIDGCHLGGYNSNSFDIPFLYSELHRRGIHWDLNNVHFIDSYKIFSKMERRDLTAAVKFYCNENHAEAHSALADAFASAKVFLNQINHYDLPRDPLELSRFCNNGKDRIDLGGVFDIDGDGDYIFTIGKHKGVKAKERGDYLQWMLSADFLPDTKSIINKILEK